MIALLKKFPKEVKTILATCAVVLTFLVSFNVSMFYYADRSDASLFTMLCVIILASSIVGVVMRVRVIQSGVFIILPVMFPMIFANLMVTAPLRGDSFIASLVFLIVLLIFLVYFTFAIPMGFEQKSIIRPDIVVFFSLEYLWIYIVIISGFIVSVVIASVIIIFMGLVLSGKLKLDRFRTIYLDN